jgi:hypothetical protein
VVSAEILSDPASAIRESPRCQGKKEGVRKEGWHSSVGVGCIRGSGASFVII